jgi:hypothetical protein
LAPLLSGFNAPSGAADEASTDAEKAEAQLQRGPNAWDRQLGFALRTSFR